MVILSSHLPYHTLKTSHPHLSPILSEQKNHSGTFNLYLPAEHKEWYRVDSSHAEVKGADPPSSRKSIYNLKWTLYIGFLHILDLISRNSINFGLFSPTVVIEKNPHINATTEFRSLFLKSQLYSRKEIKDWLKIKKYKSKKRS